ncbi:hypothetical protein JCM11251_000052 [Rhodosporidiobolus azoricus]
MDAATIHPPDSNHSDFSPYNVPYEQLMGKCIASTLPLWKGKRDVSITYSPIERAPATTLDDLVQFRYASSKPDSTPWKVKGVDTLQTDVEGNGARWKWRGKGLLKISTSQWQILGYHLSPSPPSTDTTALAAAPAEPEWVVTYFSSTLFTPAGLDIYTRRPDALSDEQVEELVKKLEGLGANVEKLVQNGGMFRVPHSS